MAPTRTAGRLLVATPPLVDANFDRSVVLMVDHDEEGAVGVVLNRPGAQSLPEPLDRWGDLLSPPTVLFHGGPVSPEALLALGSARNRDSETALIAGHIRSVDLSADPVLAGADLNGVRVFSGYSGWGAGQLEGELAAGAWIVVDAVDGDLLDDDPDTLWRRVLRRQTGRVSWLAGVPDDLSAN